MVDNDRRRWQALRMPLAIYFYDVVLAVHIAAIVVAFGVTFAYPLMEAVTSKANPRAMAGYHHAQAVVGQKIIAPAGGLALLAGAYLATDRDLWSKVWVTIPLIILVALLALGGAFFGPNEKKAAELAERDIAAAGEGEVVFSDEYKAIRAKVAMVGAIGSVAVLVAIFFMTAKPGGY